MEISKFVTLGEVINSNTAIANGIDNTPSPVQIALIKNCAKNIFDPLRVAAEGPIKINSVFRSTELNKKLEGSLISQHLAGIDSKLRSYGAAFDVDDYYYFKNRSKFDNIDMGMYIMENLVFDQLIFEYPIGGYPKWIHFSLRPDNNRNEILIATKGGYLFYEQNKKLIHK